jgi:dTDP-4-amino-4,6-dideoxygalactose transaminase
LSVIEDAGEAFGAEYQGTRIGTHGNQFTVFSFSPVRHITTGEGAVIVCRDADSYERARIWRRYGIPSTGFRDSRGEIERACDITVPGVHNYMNRVAGALGSLQMTFAAQIVDTCRSNGEFFDRTLRGVPGARLLARDAGTIPSYWVYCFLAERRDDLLRKLRQDGIYASTVHIRNDAYSCFGGVAADLPGVAEFEQHQICVPCGWWIGSEEREFIAAAIQAGW